MTRKNLLLLPLLAILSLPACSSDDDKAPLEGERISVLELQNALEPDDAALSAQGLVTPEPWRNEFWPQAGGYPNHSMQNLALNTGALKRVWSADIGTGTTDELPLTAQPIVADGKVFTLDTESQLSAFDAQSGKNIWRVNVRKKKEKDDPVISGGVSFGGGVLYVTNGYDEVLALKPADGSVFWRKKIGAPSRSAPTILDQRVFVSTLDNRLLALNAVNGEVLWEYTGLSESAGLIGAASPAAGRDIVVPVFSSGEITALRVENGSVAWSDNLSSSRRLGNLDSINDIKAHPVIDKGLVIGISFSDRLVAIDERTGSRVWQREIGGSNTPWLAGNHLFVLSLNNELIALGRETGSIIWVAKLPRFDGDDPVLFTGPILAGGRLFVFGSGGRVLEVKPDTGKVITEWDAGDSVLISPVIAAGTMYTLSEDGTLSAYR
jgi:outer membrane protein assembly factor BamB